MPGSPLEPECISCYFVLKLAQLEWIASYSHVAITLGIGPVLNSRLPALAFDNGIDSILVDREVHTVYFDARARNLRNNILILNIKRGVTAETKRGNGNLKASFAQL